MWRPLGKLFLANLRIVVRPDQFWFRLWATTTFRMMPLIAKMALLVTISAPLSLAARLFRKSAAG